MLCVFHYFHLSDRHWRRFYKTPNKMSFCSDFIFEGPQLCINSENAEAFHCYTMDCRYQADTHYSPDWWTAALATWKCVSGSWGQLLTTAVLANSGHSLSHNPLQNVMLLYMGDAMRVSLPYGFVVGSKQRSRTIQEKGNLASPRFTTTAVILIEGIPLNNSHI